MIILLILFGLLLLVVSYLLWAPLTLGINSQLGWYHLGLGPWVGVRLLPVSPAGPALQIEVAGWHRSWPVWGKAPKRPQPAAPVGRRPKPTPRRSGKVSLAQIKRLLGTFSIRRLHITFDSGDYVRNAYLFPVAYALQRQGWDVGVNWWGQNEVELLLENRVSRLLWAWWFR